MKININTDSNGNKFWNLNAIQFVDMLCNSEKFVKIFGIEKMQIEVNEDLVRIYEEVTNNQEKIKLIETQNDVILKKLERGEWINIGLGFLGVFLFTMLATLIYIF